MKRLLLGLALVASLAACGPLSDAVGAVASTSTVAAAGDKVVLEATRADLLAHEAYIAIGGAAADAIEKGVLTGAAKTKVQQLDRQVYAALLASDAATDAATKARHAASALSLLSELGSLVRR